LLKAFESGFVEHLLDPAICVLLYLCHVGIQKFYTLINVLPFGELDKRMWITKS